MRRYNVISFGIFSFESNFRTVALNGFCVRWKLGKYGFLLQELASGRF